jgi:CubicO group peptidase (beta-lactamase class C family)
VKPVTRQSQIDALLRAYDGPVPGASVLVVRDGNPLECLSFGLANLEQQIAVAPSSNFRLASLSKAFTAAAILLLVDDGLLTLDDAVRKWLPQLPESAGLVKIRHLLTHTGGLIDYEDAMPPGLTRQLNGRNVLEIVAGHGAVYFPPGKGYRYSNSGYALLALIVEAASGQRFAAFLYEHIFLPLGMLNTVAHEEGISTVANRAFGYSKEQGSWTRADQSLTSAVLGDGGIYSSIEDLARWDAALYDDRLLSETSRTLAFTAATPTDDPAVEYGMGWRITGETVWHSGETMGFRNVIVRYPRQHLTVLLLTNRNYPEPYPLALRIAGMFIE